MTAKRPHLAAVAHVDSTPAAPLELAISPQSGPI